MTTPKELSGSPVVEHTKTFFVMGAGTVKVNNYGTVEFETKGAPAVGIQPERVIWHAHTVSEIHKGVREAITEMKKEGVYAR